MFQQSRFSTATSKFLSFGRTKNIVEIGLEEGAIEFSVDGDGASLVDRWGLKDLSVVYVVVWKSRWAELPPESYSGFDSAFQLSSDGDDADPWQGSLTPYPCIPSTPPF